SSLCVFYSLLRPSRFSFFFFKYPAPTEIYTLSLHDALPILRLASTGAVRRFLAHNKAEFDPRKYLAVSTQAMKEICIARYEAFGDRKSTRLNSSHVSISYAVFCLKKKKINKSRYERSETNRI